MNPDEILAARLADDEAAAKAATPGEWEAEFAVVGGIGSAYLIQRAEDDQDVALIKTVGSPLPDHAERADAEHIARHDPARVLRDVGAGRKILAEYEASHGGGPDFDGGYSAGLEFAIRCLAEASTKEGPSRARSPG